MRKQCYLFILAITLFFIPFGSKGQTNNEDVIYFKNGNIVYGTIIEKVIDQYVTIKTDDGNILTAKWDQIVRITSVPAYLPRKTDTVMYANGTRTSGFVNSTELNVGIALGNYYGSPAYGFHSVFGYLINPEFSIGLGIGYNKCDTFSFVPLFAGFSFYTLGSTTCTVFSFDIGTSLATGDVSYKTGLILNPGISEKIHLSKIISLNIGIGYTFQAYSYYNNYNILYNSSITCVKFNLGITFE